jgi:Protein of unknown function (DUF2986)
MNRKKKGNQILRARIKKANAKLAPKSKPKYISKADRAKLEAELARKSGEEALEGEVEEPSETSAISPKN